MIAVLANFQLYLFKWLLRKVSQPIWWSKRYVRVWCVCLTEFYGKASLALYLPLKTGENTSNLGVK